MPADQLEAPASEIGAVSRTRGRIRRYERMSLWFVSVALLLEAILTVMAVFQGPRTELGPVAGVAFIAILGSVLALAFGAMILGHLRNRLKRSLGPGRGMWDLEYDPAFRKGILRRNRRQ